MLNVYLFVHLPCGNVLICIYLRIIKNNKKQLKTNINKLQDQYSMQLHNAIEVDRLFSNFLPYGYTKTVIKRAGKSGINIKGQRVRAVKSGVYMDKQILNILIELAQENEALAEAQKLKTNELLKENLWHQQHKHQNMHAFIRDY